VDQRIPLAPQHWPAWLAVALVTLVWLLPRVVRNTLATTIARFSIRRDNATNRAVRINLEACFPALSRDVRDAIFERYVALHLQALMLTPRNWWASDKSVLKMARLHNREYLDTAIAEEKPVVLLVTHSAALDAGLLALAPHYPLQGIYNPLGNRVFDWLVYRGRNRFGADAVPRGGGLRQLIKGLGHGKILLPRLVRKTGAVVVPMIAHHDSDNDDVDVHFFEPLKNYPDSDEIADATTMNRAIEATIRLQPAQFTWKLRIFKTCPNDKGTRYGQIEGGRLDVADL